MTTSEEVVRRRWRWLRFGRWILEQIEEDLHAQLEDFSASPVSDEAFADSLGVLCGNLGMLLASSDPDEESYVGYCEFETAPDLQAHLDGMRSLLRLANEPFNPRRESVTRDRIEAFLDAVKQCMEGLDWHGDWSEEEWMLVHYWSTVNAPADQRGDG